VNGTKRVSKGVQAHHAIEERLVREAQRLGCHRSKEEVVTAALEEYVRRRKQQNILCVYGDLEEEGEI
jgi:Bacterial antitoxin of type II TA system, VapB